MEEITTRPRVSLVDDDVSVRESLPDLLIHFGLAVEAFASAREFLASSRVDTTQCLILDVAMPGMSGPELQRELATRRKTIPIVFITAHANDAARMRLISSGAIECLYKPVSETALLAALGAALRMHLPGGLQPETKPTVPAATTTSLPLSPGSKQPGVEP